MQTTSTIPKGARVAAPIRFELTRKDGQPSPSEFAVPAKRAQNVGRRTRPHEIPRSHLTIPKTRDLSVDVLWEQQCSVLPHKQNWGLAWIFFTPKSANVTFTSIKVVFIGAYNTHGQAKTVQLRAKGMYPTRNSMLFKLGYWQALPVPRWLDRFNFEEIDAYNGDIIKRQMRLDFKYTKIEHEVLRRRAKAKVEVIPDSPEVATEKVEDAVHGEDESPDPPQIERPIDVWNSREVKGLVSPKQKIGLAWVLPTLQRRRKLKDITVAWLGTFKSASDANNQQCLIKKAHPEWHVHSFTVGEPIELPVPMWELQKNNQVHYDQHLLADFMHSDPVGVPAVEPHRMHEPPEDRSEEKSVVDTIMGSPEEKLDDSPDDTDLVQTSSTKRDLGHGLTVEFETFAPRSAGADTSESDSEPVLDSRPAPD